MNNVVSIVEKNFGFSLEIEERAGMLKLPKILGEDYGAILEVLKENHSECDVPPYTRYLEIDWDEQLTQSKWKMFLEVFTKKWHFFAGIPSSKEIASQGRMVKKEFDTRKYIYCRHFGPYQKVGDTYSRMVIWARENGYALESESMEFYRNDPKTVSVSDLETDLYIPVVK